MFSRAEFAKYFKVGDIIESGSAIQRQNAARLRIDAIDEEFIRYQSLNNKQRLRIRYPYLEIIIDAFPELDSRSMRGSVNAALKRKGFRKNHSTENYTYSLAKAYCDRVAKDTVLPFGSSHPDNDHKGNPDWTRDELIVAPQWASLAVLRYSD